MRSQLRPESLTKSGARTRRLRLECIDLLGRYRTPEGDVRSDPRCKGPDCGWRNADGSVGCTDSRALQFDHRDGGGSEERKTGTIAGDRLYFDIKKHPERYQLLCANCNEIKSKAEKQGARLHKRPQLVRASLQIEGQPARITRPRLSTT